MTLMTWSEHFITGIDELDEQHKFIVDQINDFASWISHANEVGADDMLPILDALNKSAQEHFEYEEELMKQGGICAEYLENHNGFHTDFSYEIALMREKLERDGALRAEDFLRFLTNWLTFHLLTEDQFMASQLREIACGTSPDIAFQDSMWNKEASKLALNDYVLGHFMELTKRNRELGIANEDLRLSQLALASFNQDLEKRVKAKMQRLVDVNAELEREKQSLTEALVEIKGVQNQLFQAEKMAAIGQLAAGVAHEINNPISFIGSNLDALANYIGRLLSVINVYEEMANNLPAGRQGKARAAEIANSLDLGYLRKEIPELLEESIDGVERIKNIVSNLKSFARVDETGWHAVDINRELENTLTVVWHEIKYKAELTKDYGELPLIHCIPSQLNHVFLSILVNAAQAIEGRGKIILRTNANEESVQIELTDTGVGMAEDVQKRIFEPFFTTKPVGVGAGLGLSTSRDIIKQHNGSIEVSSQPGKGTTFLITLPVEQPMVGLA